MREWLLGEGWLWTIKKKQIARKKLKCGNFTTKSRWLICRGSYNKRCCLLEKCKPVPLTSFFRRSDSCESGQKFSDFQYFVHRYTLRILLSVSEVLPPPFLKDQKEFETVKEEQKTRGNFPGKD